MPTARPDTDEALLLSYLDRGDLAALNALVERYQAQAYALARHSGLSAHDAEDAVQSAFVELLRSVRTFRRDGRFAPWFFRIVISTASRVRSGEARARATPAEAVEAAKMNQPAADPQELAAQADELRAIHAQLGKLDWESRLAILLRYRFNLDGAQAAVALGCPEPTFRTWLKRGLDELRAALRTRDDAALTSLLVLLPLEPVPVSLAAALHGVAAGATSAAKTSLLAKGMALMKAHPLAFVAASFGLALTAAICMPSGAQRQSSTVQNRGTAAEPRAELAEPRPKEVPVTTPEHYQSLAGGYCSKLGTLLSSGVPPLDALKLTAAETRDPEYKQIALSIADGVAKGHSLGDEFARYPREFPLNAAIFQPFPEVDITLIGTGQLLSLKVAYPSRDAGDTYLNQQNFLFYKTMDRMLDRGFSIRDALRGIEGEGIAYPVAKLAADTRADIEKGSSFSASLKRQQFPEFAVAMVSSGEFVGHLEVACRELAIVYEHEMQFEHPGEKSFVQTRNVAAILWSLGQAANSSKPQAEILKRLSTDFSSEPFHSVLAAAAVDASQGVPLSSILAKNPKLFGPSAVQMARAGEQGNVLNFCLLRLAWQYLGEDEATLSRVDVEGPLPKLAPATESKAPPAKKDTDF